MAVWEVLDFQGSPLSAPGVGDQAGRDGGSVPLFLAAAFRHRPQLAEGERRRVDANFAREFVD